MLTIDFKRIDIPEGSHILDLGCGEGRHIIHAQMFNRAALNVGVDIETNNIHTAKARLDENREYFKTLNQENETTTKIDSGDHWCVADGNGLPFIDGCFDVVICSEVLEHISDYRNMLEEINRVLKPGGMFAMSVPRAWPEKICWALSSAYHQVDGGHVRIFNDRHLKAEIEALAFNYQQKHWAHSLHTIYWWLRCLFWNQGDKFFPVRWYHKFLLWDLMKKPWITRVLDAVLNPVLGKSTVMYFTKSQS